MTCANCRRPAAVRIGRKINGAGWQESDFCMDCASDVHTRTQAAVAALHTAALTYGPPGQPIYRDDQVTR